VFISLLVARYSTSAAERNLALGTYPTLEMDMALKTKTTAIRYHRNTSSLSFHSTNLLALSCDINIQATILVCISRACTPRTASIPWGSPGFVHTGFVHTLDSFPPVARGTLRSLPNSMPERRRSRSTPPHFPQPEPEVDRCRCILELHGSIFVSPSLANTM
jgi:hypothetical protein